MFLIIILYKLCMIRIKQYSFTYFITINLIYILTTYYKLNKINNKIYINYFPENKTQAAVKLSYGNCFVFLP